MFDKLDIIQEPNGKFVLRNWARSVDLKYENVSWLYNWYIQDIEEFDLDKAKEFYNLSN